MRPNQFPPPTCRLHGQGCRTPWGYDPDHTDSHRPYPVDELAARADSPHRYAYPDHQAYLDGWTLWKALRRDGFLNQEESEARETVILRHMGVTDVDTFAEYTEQVIKETCDRYGIDVPKG